MHKVCPFIRHHIRFISVLSNVFLQLAPCQHRTNTEAASRWVAPLQLTLPPWKLFFLQLSHILISALCLKEDPEHFEVFDKAFITLFYVTGGDPWPETLPKVDNFPERSLCQPKMTTKFFIGLRRHVSKMQALSDLSSAVGTSGLGVHVEIIWRI